MASNRNYVFIEDDEVALPPRSLPEDVDVIDLNGVEEGDLEEDDQRDRFRPNAVSRPRSRKQPGAIGLRNPNIEYPLVVIPSYSFGNHELRVNKTIEMKDGNFLQIKAIVRHEHTTEVFLRGLLLKRSRDMLGMLPMKLNEVVFCFDIDLDDPRPPMVQSAIHIRLADVKKIRSLVCTNQTFPLGKREWQGYETKAQVEADGRLTVRWKQTRTFFNARHRIDGRFTEEILERLAESEIPKYQLRVAEKLIRARWRGSTTAGGAFGSTAPIYTSGLAKPASSNDLSTHLGAQHRGIAQAVEETGKRISFIDLDAPTPSPSKRRKTSIAPHKSRAVLEKQSSTAQYTQPTQKYTYGDCFCGSGGASNGAKGAKLHTVYGFDNWGPACDSWKINNSSGSVYHLDAFDFLAIAGRNDMREKVKVDILHLSCPCQFFSPAHTVAGKNDETNTASLFAVRNIIEKCRPRVATFEQTFGILREGKVEYFRAMVHMLTEQNYSVRYKLVNFQDWGSPSRRLRLIVIAACAGEVLPDIPAATHAKNPAPGSGLKPFVTVHQALAAIPLNALDHDIAAATYTHGREKPSWNPHQILRRAITCNGGGDDMNYHPTGKRKFTNREFAALQTYPVDYIFAGTRGEQLKQIGNSVPPLAAKVLFKGIRKALQKADGVAIDDEDREYVIIDD